MGRAQLAVVIRGPVATRHQAGEPVGSRARTGDVSRSLRRRKREGAAVVVGMWHAASVRSDD